MATIAITAAVLGSRIVGRNWLVSATNFHLRVGRSPCPLPSTSRGRALRLYRSRCALSDVGFCGRGYGASVPHSNYYLERQPGRSLDAGAPTRLSGWHDSPLRFGSCGFIWRYLGQYPCASSRPRNDLAIFLEFSFLTLKPPVPSDNMLHIVNDPSPGFFFHSREP
jgi:hypothetical protein